ncbi:putative RNA-directed DNA polymerase [Helianthus annuus]|nr:putative RNA-directed DNA polymerase [Helianthus annuus]
MYQILPSRQDLWNVVNGSETRAPTNDINGAIGKWHIKAGRAMFIIKTTVEEDVLDHIQDLEYPKQAWETLETLFSKKDDARLQLLESELMTASQGDLSIPQYFRKVKNLCREIGDLDPQSKISETRLKRILIHGLNPEYRSFITAIQGWATQPSITEFENLLAGQESLAKKLAGVSIKHDEDKALYAKKSKGRGKPWQSRDRNQDKEKAVKDRKGKGVQNQTESDSGKKEKSWKGKRFPFKCHNCGVRGHMAKDCNLPKEEGNVATQEEQPWDMEAMVAQVVEDVALTATTELKQNNLGDWIIDSGCSNHMTGEKDRLKKVKRYNGNHVVVIADNSRHQIANVGEVCFPAERGQTEFVMSDVFHVPGMKKNLFSVPQVTSTGKYVLFGPTDVKIFEKFETKSVPILQGKRNDTVYVLSAESTYVDKAKQNQTADLWHARLSHVGYDRLELIMKRNLINGLPSFEVNKEMVCAGCQFGKSHQLPFEPSSHKTKEPLEIVHSDVLGPIKQESNTGKRYMVTFIDDYSRYLRENKIRRQLTCSNTPQQNGVSERKNRHLGETCRSMIHDKNVPGRYWAEGMKTACYVINRLPSQTLGYKSPFEKLFELKPDVSHLRVFGCVCYVFIPNHLRHKMEKKAIRCIFIGYDAERKGWRCCDPTTNKCYVSRNVVFDENSSWWAANKEPVPDTEDLKTRLETVMLSLGNEDEIDTVEVDNYEGPTSSPVRRQSQPNPWQTGTSGTHNQAQDVGPNSPTSVSGRSEASSPASNLRRSERARRPNPKYMVNVATVEPVEREPESYDQAKNQEEWIEAMEEEIEAMTRNETWVLVPKPEGVKPVTCKWVYKIKRKSDGTVDRFKARLVARGFSQQYGIDYEDTFSPVAKLTTIRVVIAVAASKNWVMHQMDVNNAFLYGDLNHTIHMEQPKGFEDKAHPDYVCKLKKAIYGLKQSPRAWFGKIGEFLQHNDFIMCQADASLFVREIRGKVVVVLIYVDDLVITGNDEDGIKQLKENLCVRFRMKDLGILSHFLGLELKYESDAVVLHQQKYCIDLLTRFGMLDCKPATTPNDTTVKLCVDRGRELEDPTMYRQIVGSLVYLTLTRPDISFIVGVLSRYMQRPRKPHLDAIRRLLRYVKATFEYGIKFNHGKKLELIGYCDADYAGDLDTRRSTSGYVFMLGQGPVVWCSKRQATVSLSTTEAEYKSAAMAAQEISWLRLLLKELKQEIEEKVVLHCDNLSSIHLAENPMFHARSKHIEVQYHFIREKVINGEVDLKYVDTNQQLADIFTKSLAHGKLIKFCEKLNMKIVNIEREY